MAETEGGSAVGSRPVGGSPTGKVAVQVVYAPPPPAPPVILRLSLATGATIGQALEESGIAAHTGGVSIDLCKVGIWGKLKERDTVLREDDRIEIYRPLIADPMEARRRRAKKKSTERPSIPVAPGDSDA